MNIIPLLFQYLCSGEPEGLIDFSDMSQEQRELYFDSESKEAEHNGCGEDLNSSQTEDAILP